MAAAQTNPFLKSSLFNAVEKVLRIAINIIIFALMNNALSVEDMGQYNFYLLSFTVLTVVAGFGITENATKTFLDHQQSFVYFKALLSIKLALAFIFSFVGYFGFFDHNIYFTLGVLLSSFSLSSQYLESLGLGKIILKANSLVLSLLFFVKLWACITQQDLMVFCQIFALEVLLQSLVLLVCAVSFRTIEKGAIKLVKVVKQLNYKSLSFIWFSACIGILYLKVDQFMVKYFLSDIDVGYYTFAARIIDYGMLIPSLILASLMAFFYQVSVQKRKVIYSFLILISIPLILLINGASWILVYFYLPQYQHSILLIALLSVSMPFAFWRILTGKFLIIDGKTEVFLVRSSVLLIVNILLCVVLIPLYGMIGAACANMLTVILGGYVIDLFHKQTYDVVEIKKQSFVELFNPKYFLQQLKQLKNNE